MFFCVRFIDVDTFEKTKDVNEFSTDLTDDVKRALNVRNTELMVNPDCFVGIIMDFIWHAAGISEEEKVNFDIITSQGKFLNVYNYLPNTSGLEVFLEKDYYISYRDCLKPLLCKKSQSYYDLIEGKKRRVKNRKSKTSLTRESKVSSVSVTVMQKLSNARIKRGPSRVGKDLV